MNCKPHCRVIMNQIAAKNPKSAAAALNVADQTENIKDTVESLIVAFILAFVFRGFLVEAFVIPTGSMAPTLLGEHGTQICPDCGWEFAYGMPQTNPYRDQIKCPNCERTSQVHSEMPYHGPGNGCDLYHARKDPSLMQKDPLLAQRIRNLSFMPQSGDRILVFKWPYDLGGQYLEPHPWDVVVFKNPAHQGDNYIKRLLGVPNEVVEILDGDVFTCPVSELDASTVHKMERVVELKNRMLNLSGFSRSGVVAEIKGLQREIVNEITDHLRISRKTATAQKALWQVVFHQDYLPPPDITMRPDRPHWQPQVDDAQPSHWRTFEPRLHFDGLEAKADTIRFAGKSTGDFYAYNYSSRMGSNTLYEVGDLRLKFVLNYSAGDGELVLRMSKHNDLFTVRLNPAGGVVLTREPFNPSRRVSTGSAQVLQARKIAPWQSGRPIEVEFTNVDYRLSVIVDGNPVVQSSDEDYAPDIPRLRRRSRAVGEPVTVEIAADHLDIQLWHLQLDRDVYYRSSDPDDGLAGWGTAGNPIYLRDGEYFVLGDNSPASQDSRLWDKPGRYLRYRGQAYQVGTVSHDQMIGRAFFVYWPSGFRIRWLPILENFGLVPDVGKMRWIR